MSLMSRGLSLSTFTGRQASSKVAPGARSIHTPRAQLLKQTRNLVTRFFTHLTTPGFSHPVAGSSFHSAWNAARQPTIQHGLSLPVRHALSRPLGAKFLPRPPTVTRSTFQVGLGTARNFSTTRPIFQHLVENVPVAGRALYEADWDVKRKAETKDKMRKSLKAAKENKQTSGSKSLLKPKQQQENSEVAEVEHYFSTPVVPAVTTYLLIPIAPTPTARLPLSTAAASGSHPLLPFAALGELHAAHRTHAARVASLFARLDAASVWDERVTCSAHGDRDGLCTVLQVAFRGWTAAMVRGVIGEGGQGWCVLEEVADEAGAENSHPGVSSHSLANVETRDAMQPPPHDIDPATAFVLPTLSFSSSVLSAAESTASVAPMLFFPPSPALSCTDPDVGSPSISDLDMLSNADSADYGADGSSWADDDDSPSLASSGSGSWVGLSLSSDFVRRVDSVRGDNGWPRDDAFD